MQGQITNEINSFLTWKASHTRRAALNYRIWLERLDEYLNKPIEEYVLEDILAFQRRIEQKYSEATVALAIAGIKGMLGFLKTQGVDTIPCELIRIPKKTTIPPHAIAESEFQKIMSLMGESTYKECRDKLILRLLWDTGVRVSELCSLNVNDLARGNQMCTISTRKSRNLRLIFWSDETQKLVYKYLGVRLNIDEHERALFTRVKGRAQRLTTRSVQRIVKRNARKAELRSNVSPHSFRHGKAHQILLKGGNPKDIGAILGHSELNPAASFQYLKLSDTELEKRARQYL